MILVVVIPTSTLILVAVAPSTVAGIVGVVVPALTLAGSVRFTTPIIGVVCGIVIVVGVPGLIVVAVTGFPALILLRLVLSEVLRRAPGIIVAS
jgi:hypothetical protein